MICECESADCMEPIIATYDELIWMLRANPRAFFVIPGHEGPDDEVVTTDSDGRFLAVVER